MSDDDETEMYCGRARLTLSMECLAEFLKLPKDIFISNVSILPEDANFNRFSIILAGPGLQNVPEGAESFCKTLAEIRETKRDGR